MEALDFSIHLLSSLIVSRWESDSKKCKISSYLKKYHNDVAVHLKCDPMEKTYQVILIIGNLYLVRNRVFAVLINSSVEQR